MHDQHQINIKSVSDIPFCQQALISHLAFDRVNIAALNSCFKGVLCVDTFSSLPVAQAVKIDMFSHITEFAHADIGKRCQQHCILIHSIFSLILSSQKEQVHLPAGCYMLIPAWELFSLKSQSHHYGLIFMFDIAQAGLNLQSVSALFWKVGNHLHYGNMVNSLLCDYYAPLTDACYKQLLLSINSLLLLQSEHVFCPCDINKTHVIPNFDIGAIVHEIRRNMTNPNYSLNDLANRFGMATRELQYKLARYHLSFSELLASGRCELLAMTIRNRPDVNLDILVRHCGFTNPQTANQQFKKRYNQTAVQFQVSELMD